MHVKALTLALVLGGAVGQFGGGGKSKPAPAPQKKDLEYIACAVCEKTVEALYDIVDEKTAELPSYKKKLEELDINDALEKVCKTDTKEGVWIRRQDITERKDSKGHRYLELVEPGGTAKCGPECATISHSCYQLLEEEIDSDVLSAMLWKGKTSVEDAKAKVCKKMTKRCVKWPQGKPLSGKSGHRTDYPFEGQSDKDLEMEQLMASMKASGMGGMSMYNREDMEAMAAGGMGGLGGMGGGYGEEGDEDADPYGGMGGMGGMGGGGSAGGDMEF